MFLGTVLAPAKNWVGGWGLLVRRLAAGVPGPPGGSIFSNRTRRPAPLGQGGQCGTNSEFFCRFSFFLLPLCPPGFGGPAGPKIPGKRAPRCKFHKGTTFKFWLGGARRPCGAVGGWGTLTRNKIVCRLSHEGVGIYFVLALVVFVLTRWRA